MDDQELIRRANCGDEEAMTALYEKHRDFCMNVAMKYLQDRDEAADVLQETFSYFFAKFPGFVLSCRLTTFLFPVVRNLSLTRLRRRRHSEDPAVLENTADAPLRDLQIERQRLLDMLADLPEEHRSVVLMRFADQMSLDEIALVLNIPQGTVKSRLHNALKKLRHSTHFLWFISLWEMSDF